MKQPTDPTYQQRCEASRLRRGDTNEEDRCRQEFEKWQEWYCNNHGIGSRWDEIEAAWKASWSAALNRSNK